MIQNGTRLNIIDNSGAKVGACIKVLTGYRRRYALVGDRVKISVKSLRSKRRSTLKLKKGEIYDALVVRTKINTRSFSGDSISFFENSAILLKKQNKYVGTRIFGCVPKNFRFSKFLKIISLSSGMSF